MGELPLLGGGSVVPGGDNKGSKRLRQSAHNQDLEGRPASALAVRRCRRESADAKLVQQQWQQTVTMVDCLNVLEGVKDSSAKGA